MAIANLDQAAASCRDTAEGMAMAPSDPPPGTPVQAPASTKPSNPPGMPPVPESASEAPTAKPLDADWPLHDASLPSGPPNDGPDDAAPNDDGLLESIGRAISAPVRDTANAAPDAGLKGPDSAPKSG